MSEMKDKRPASPTDKVEYMVGGVLFVLIMIMWIITATH